MKDATKDELHARLIDWFTQSEDSTQDARAEAERARDYVDGRQLTTEELAVLRDRGQPPVIDNRIRPKVNYLLGMEKRSRTDPRAFPRNPGDDDAANAATDAIRFVCDLNLFEDLAAAVLENILVEGFGGVDVVVERDDAGGHKVVIEHYPWDRLFYDPHSRRPDFSDAKYLGGVAWMDEDDIPAKWGKGKKAKDAISGAYAYGSSTGTFDDKPENIWADMKRKRVRVIQEHWTQDGVWWFATFTAGGFLDEPMVSPYLDDEGKPECSLLLQSGYVDRKNWRYGVVRDMFDPQDEVNKRRSKALHLLSVRQVIAEQGAVEDKDHARAQVAQADGYVEVTPGMRFDIQQTTDLAAGQFQLLQEAKLSMEATGPNSFMQGKQSQAASGRAIMASQQGGAIEMDGAIMDRFHQWKRRVYRTIWHRIRQFMTAEWWVRVTDDERNVRFVGLNRPVTMADGLANLPAPQRQAVEQQLALVPNDPRLSMPIMQPDGQPMIANNVAEMMVDIIVDETPDVASLQIEQFTALADLAMKMPGAIPMDAIVEASSLRNKDKLLERMRPPTGPDGQPLPPPPPPEIVKMQMEAETKAKVAAADAEARQIKAQQDQTAEMARLQQQMELDRQKQAHEEMMAEQRFIFETRLAERRLEGEMELARRKALAQAELAREAAEAGHRRADMADQRETVPAE